MFRAPSTWPGQPPPSPVCRSARVLDGLLRGQYSRQVFGDADAEPPASPHFLVWLKLLLPTARRQAPPPLLSLVAEQSQESQGVLSSAVSAVSVATMAASGSAESSTK